MHGGLLGGFDQVLQRHGQLFVGAAFCGGKTGGEILFVAELNWAFVPLHERFKPAFLN